MDRHIVSFEVPAIGIAVARLTDSWLRNRPVAVASASTPRTCLQEVSAEAEREGVFAGMSVGEARRYCPPLQVLPPNPVLVRQANQCLFDVVARFAPIWEPRRPGHWFLDLTGTTRLFGLAAETAARIEREVAHQYGLAGVVGVANTKLVSHIAAKLMAPLQLCEVRPGSEQTFLAPLSVATLPGLSQFPKPTMLVALEELNITTLGELADISQQHLELVLGQRGVLLHNWAQGVDPSPVLAPPRRNCLQESLVLEPDELDEHHLLGLLYRLLECVCRRLRQQQRVCQRLVLTLRYSDHVMTTGRQAIPSRTHWESELFPCLQILLRRCSHRRVRVRSMTLGVEVLTPVEGQLPLFPEEVQSLRSRCLTLALDRLRERFGERAIWFGRTAPPPAIPLCSKESMFKRDGRGGYCHRGRYLVKSYASDAVSFSLSGEIPWPTEKPR